MSRISTGSSVENSGVTLLELLFVIVISGVLLALAIPAFKNVIVETNLSLTANRIAGYFRLARSKAVTDVNVHCGIHFSKDSSYYRTFLDVNNSNVYETTDQWYGERQLLPKKILFVNFEDPNSDILQYNSAVVFRGDGSAKVGIGTSIRIRYGTNGPTRTIKILPSTGRIRMENP